MPDYLYIAGQPAGPIKVGISASPRKRMAQLRTASADDIQLIECYALGGSAKSLEQAVHTALAAGNMAREWFKVGADEARTAIAAAALSLGLSIMPADKIVEGEAIANKRGRKPDPNAKKSLTLRLDPDVIEHFKATGEGWQTRMNEALRKAAGI